MFNVNKDHHNVLLKLIFGCLSPRSMAPHRFQLGLKPAALIRLLARCEKRMSYDIMLIQRQTHS